MLTGSNRHVALKTNLTVTVVEAADLPVTSNENRNLFCVVGVVEVTSKKNQERATPNFEKNFKPYEVFYYFIYNRESDCIHLWSMCIERSSLYILLYFLLQSFYDLVGQELQS